MLLRKIFVNTAICLAAFTACNKDEGTGGEGSISGILMIREFDPEFKQLQRVKPAADENVYIIFGSGTSMDDKTTAAYNGSFRFNYLRDGNYTIYAYADDTSRILGKKMPVVTNVKISNGANANADTIYINKAIAIDKGTSSVKGKIWLINYKSNGFEIKDIALAQEQDVYLMYGDHKSFDIRTRTNYNGEFAFDNLIKGTYTVFVYSEKEDSEGNLTGATEKDIHKEVFNIATDTTSYFMTDTIKTF